MNAVVLYGNPLSNYVRAARMVCEEKGVEHELVTIPSLKALKEPEHLARHPFGKVPTLEHGDVSVFETSAICRYIDEAFDGPSLQPSDPATRARMEQWISVTNAYLDTDVMRRFVLHYFFPRGPEGKPDQARIDKALPDIRRDFEVLDRALANADYLAGDQLTIADLMLAPIISLGLATPEGDQLILGCDKLKAWTEKMFARDSFAATAPPAPDNKRTS
jgi:glutathione S-transferase